MQPDSRPRLFFIDNLRIGLISLVVAHHVGQAYGPTGGWWYFMDPEKAPILGAFFTVNRSFFMSLFFMISGYFLPQSFDRKARGFLKDRFARLGIPLLVFAFLIIPVMMYVYHVNFRPYGPISFPSYYRHFYLGHGPRPPLWIGPAWPDLNFGHLWFVEHLLIFAVCYRLWRLMPFSGAPGRRAEGRPPRSLEIIAFAVVLAALTFVVRLWYPIDRWIALLKFIQVAFADVPRDLAFFVIGVVAYRRNWFSSMPKKSGMAWLLVGLTACASCYALFFTGHTYFMWRGHLRRLSLRPVGGLPLLRDVHRAHGPLPRETEPPRAACKGPGSEHLRRVPPSRARSRRAAVRDRSWSPWPSDEVLCRYPRGGACHIRNQWRFEARSPGPVHPVDVLPDRFEDTAST
jgi:fucose 4-O-acetylase-like acetyltransferase